MFYIVLLFNSLYQTLAKRNPLRIAAPHHVGLHRVVVEESDDGGVAFELGVGYDPLHTVFDVVLVQMVEDDGIEPFVLVFGNDSNQVHIKQIVLHERLFYVEGTQREESPFCFVKCL